MKIKREVKIYGSLIAFLLIAALAAMSYNSNKVNSFEDCVNAGNPVMESYPRQCRDQASGKLFVEKIPDFWKYDGIMLMQHETDKFYGCFGCGATLCLDPVAEMKPVNETESRYCSPEFEVVVNGTPDYS